MTLRSFPLAEVVASDSEPGDREPENAVDGSDGTRWASGPASGDVDIDVSCDAPGCLAPSSALPVVPLGEPSCGPR